MENFQLSEFKCHCCGAVNMNHVFLDKLDRARTRAGIPFIIISGFRCQRHNLEVGSTSDNHTQGIAADVKCIIGPNRLKLVDALLKENFVRIGVGKDFIHCDINNKIPSLWVYASK
jgi:zinc D-Ala-D-Ala carboxypeptidase